MRKTYTLTNEEFANLCSLSIPAPMMRVGNVITPSPEEAVNGFWERLAKEKGFDVETIQCDDPTKPIFTAIPLPITLAN